MTEFHGNKNLPKTQHKIGHSWPLFSKARVCQSFEIPNAAFFWRVFWRSWITHMFPSLVGSGHNHRWCELQRVLELVLRAFWVLDRHQDLTDGRLTNTQNWRTERKIYIKTLRQEILYKLLGKYKIAKSKISSLNIIPWKVNRKWKEYCDVIVYLHLSNFKNKVFLPLLQIYRFISSKNWDDLNVSHVLT